MTTKLSPSQQEAMDQAIAHNGLVRWPGGFWTYDGCDVARVDAQLGYSVPAWWVQTNTVKSLATKGLVQMPDYKTALLVETEA